MLTLGQFIRSLVFAAFGGAAVVMIALPSAHGGVGDSARHDSIASGVSHRRQHALNGFGETGSLADIGKQRANRARVATKRREHGFTAWETLVIPQGTAADPLLREPACIGLGAQI